MKRILTILFCLLFITCCTTKKDKMNENKNFAIQAYKAQYEKLNVLSMILLESIKKGSYNDFKKIYGKDIIDNIAKSKLEEISGILTEKKLNKEKININIKTDSKKGKIEIFLNEKTTIFVSAIQSGNDWKINEITSK